MSRWLEALLLAVTMALATSRQAVTQAKDLGALQDFGVDEVILAIPSAPGFASREQAMQWIAPALLSGDAAGAA